jgi:hypothetical protein
MALFYINGASMDVTVGYVVFQTAFLLQTEAEQLAFADRLAEKARLLRKAILNKTVVSQADGVFAAEGGTTNPVSPAIVGTWVGTAEATPTGPIILAARDCFKAANNDV